LPLWVEWLKAVRSLNFEREKAMNDHHLKRPSVGIMIAIPALGLAAAAVIVAGGALRDMRDLKQVSSERHDELLEFMRTLNRSERQAIAEQTHEITRQVDRLIKGPPAPAFQIKNIRPH
jgi:hypothetical protein